MLGNSHLAVCHCDVFKDLKYCGKLNSGVLIWYWEAWILFHRRLNLGLARQSSKNSRFRFHTYPGLKDKSSKILDLPTDC